MFLKIFKSMGKYLPYDVHCRVKHKSKCSKIGNLRGKMSVEIDILIDLHTERG